MNNWLAFKEYSIEILNIIQVTLNIIQDALVANQLNITTALATVIVFYLAFCWFKPYKKGKKRIVPSEPAPEMELTSLEDYKKEAAIVAKQKVYSKIACPKCAGKMFNTGVYEGQYKDGVPHEGGMPHVGIACERCGHSDKRPIG